MSKYMAYSVPATQALGAARCDRDKTLGSHDMRTKPPAALLLHTEMAHSITSVQREGLVLQLQRWLGNSCVAGILESQRYADHRRTRYHATNE